MGLDLEALLPTLTPEKQEEILDQLDIETAEKYKKKGYGLQVSQPQQPKPSKSEQNEPDGFDLAGPAKFGLFVAGFVGNLIVFAIGLLLLTVHIFLGLVVLTLSGVPLAVALIAPTRR